MRLRCRGERARERTTHLEPLLVDALLDLVGLLERAFGLEGLLGLDVELLVLDRVDERAGVLKAGKRPRLRLDVAEERVCARGKRLVSG